MRSSGPTRASTARDLDARPRAQDTERVDWREVLEMACLAVLDLYRSGEPFNLVGHRPISAPDTRRVIAPWLPKDRATLVYAPWGAGKSTLGAAIVTTLERVCE